MVIWKYTTALNILRYEMQWKLKYDHDHAFWIVPSEVRIRGEWLHVFYDFISVWGLERVNFVASFVIYLFMTTKHLSRL